MFDAIKKTYRSSLKPADSLFNIYPARPLAAVVVVYLARTRVTPNQVTLFSITPMLAGLTAWMCIDGLWGLWLGVLGVELAYVLDCADGQLARVTGRTSVVGGELDFMLDEIKAYLLIAALTVRWIVLEDGGFKWTVCRSIHSRRAGHCALSHKVRAQRRVCGGNGYGATRPWTIGGRSPCPKEPPVARRNGGPLHQSISGMHTHLCPLQSNGSFVWAYGVVHILYTGQIGLKVSLALGRFAPKDTQSNDEDGS